MTPEPLSSRQQAPRIREPLGVLMVNHSQWSRRDT
jgi:hypothetical protein